MERLQKAQVFITEKSYRSAAMICRFMITPVKIRCMTITSESARFGDMITALISTMLHYDYQLCYILKIYFKYREDFKIWNNNNLDNIIEEYANISFL